MSAGGPGRIAPAAADVNLLRPEWKKLLALRTARLSAKWDESEGEVASLGVAQFPIGERQYAIPLDRMRAVIPLRTATAIPLVASQIVGVVRFQGDLLTAYSLASLLGVQGWGRDPTVLLVVAPEPDRLVALDSEQIPRPGTLPLAVIERARRRADEPSLDVMSAEGGAIRLLDLGRLFEIGPGERRGA